MSLDRRRFLALVGLTTIGCSTDPAGSAVEPRELTTEEAERLAVARFNNDDRHYAPFTLQTSGEGATFFIRGRVDFRGHVGYGSVASSNQPNTFALQWTLAKRAVTPATSDVARLSHRPMPPGRSKT